MKRVLLDEGTCIKREGQKDAKQSGNNVRRKAWARKRECTLVIRPLSVRRHRKWLRRRGKAKAKEEEGKGGQVTGRDDNVGESKQLFLS